MNDRTMPIDDVILRGRAVTKTYKTGRLLTPVLHGVDLEVHRGEMVGLMGSSGAGKSTLLHILGLLDTPTSGVVELHGQDVSSRGGQRRAALRNREIGFVFQFYHLIPELTAIQNTLLPGMVSKNPIAWSFAHRKEKRRALALLDRVGLSHRLRHRPSALSGGERQRVAVARALLARPSIVLCDEPTGNLDSVTGAEIIDLLFDINRSDGTTFVIVTHDDSLAPRFDRVVTMKDGRIQNETRKVLEIGHTS
ncbi:MAG: ABC transporter ATP-binding protein [Planctomycetes bacterium]|nr:ABC transporter ATP-binding protein [Planctomycetota bacterium]